MRRNIHWLGWCLGLVVIVGQLASAIVCSAQYYDDCNNCDPHGRRHAGACVGADGCCICDHHGWDGKRRKSFQQQKDLFYNYYAQPGPFYNQAGQLYVSPLPVPANVGHTYTTYQPFMPHEYTYRHNRSYYTYNRGSGWTRTNVRYGTCGNWFQAFGQDWHYPMTNNIAAVHNDFFYPYRR